MTRSRRFAQVDVFGSVPYTGNPVAVIVEGDDISDLEMQRIARRTNLSETTFILPATDPNADYRLRIFTPGGELPFAGHPTLGSAHAWLEQGGLPRAADRILQQCEAGLIPVRIADGALAFAAPPTRRDGPISEDDLLSTAAAFGIPRDAIIAHQWVDNGPGWAVVRLASAQAVLALDPDLSLIPDAMIGAIGDYPPGSPFAYEMRTFAPRLNVAEDPVCGSMNASVAQWRLREGEVTASFHVSQGARVGRAGAIAISVADDQVWVGGATVTCISGEIEA